MAKLRGLKGLLYYRQRAGLTQQQLAERLEVSRASVILWETGQGYPRAEMLPVIAETLSCSIDELYQDCTEGKEACQCSAASPTCTEGTEPLQV